MKAKYFRNAAVCLGTMAMMAGSAVLAQAATGTAINMEDAHTSRPAFTRRPSRRGSGPFRRRPSRQIDAEFQRKVVGLRPAME